MSDEIYRRNAEQCIRDARHYRGLEKESECFKAIDWYLRIEIITRADVRAIAAQYRNLAIVNFNTGSVNRDNQDKACYFYAKAGDYYTKSIEKLHQIPLAAHDIKELGDQDFRELTELYIDLSDVCINLAQVPAAHEAVRNAGTAFMLIRSKNAAELLLGNPTDNYAAFRDYFERKSSEPSFLASAKYKNDAGILLAQHEEKCMASLLDGMSIPEKTSDEIGSIGEMMSGLGLSNGSTAPVFARVRFEQHLSDVDYRYLAIDYLKLTQLHIQKNSIIDTIATYRQALGALHQIKVKNDNDLMIIKTIEDQITYLTTQPKISMINPPQVSSALRHQNVQAPGSIISKMSMFGTFASPAAAAETESDLTQVSQLDTMQ